MGQTAPRQAETGKRVPVFICEAANQLTQRTKNIEKEACTPDYFSAVLAGNRICHQRGVCTVCGYQRYALEHETYRHNQNVAIHKTNQRWNKQ
jgi:hypothetical protein